jgi:hypothetical protein
MPSADSWEKILAKTAADSRNAPGSNTSPVIVADSRNAPGSNSSWIMKADSRNAPGSNSSLILAADSRNAPGSNLSPLPSGSGSGDGQSGNGNGNGSNNVTSGGSAAIPTTSVKVATPDIILVNQETLPVELMTNLIFEDIGGQELISLSRHDLITGSGLAYQPITNLNDIAIQYSSQNIIPMPDSSSNYLSNFPINLDIHTIEEFSSTDASHIKINSSNELEIQVTNMKIGEQIEVEILTSISAYNDTKSI